MTLTFTARGPGAAELLIYDEISSSSGVSAKDVDAQLKALGPLSALTVRINSPGGETIQAAAIYNMLARLKASGTFITVLIDGVAASAASWVAMIGNDIAMPENAMMMIHNPAGVVVGNATDMRDVAQVLDKIRDTMVSAYVAKSGKTAAEVEVLMEAETWYSAKEAVAAGFADRVVQPIKIAASFDPARFAKRQPVLLVADLDPDRIWSNYRKGQPTPTAASTRNRPTTLTRQEIERRMGAAS